MNRLRHCWRYLEKVYALPARLRAVRDRRQYPVIPTWSLHLTLVLGAVLRLPSLLDLSLKTRKPGFQRLIDHGAISHDALGYALEHGRPEDWRELLAATLRQLKANKGLESAKLGGLLVLAVDANEQFHSRSRCCADCAQRRVSILGADAQPTEVIEYYHRQVYAQINGPDFSVVLDLEPLRPGEEEAAAALRLLGRLRRLYGVRFFDVVTVDAWYARGPFLRGVDKLGWGVVSVLKQERYEVYQEATTLAASASPLRWQHAGREIELREVNDLDFARPELGKVRVVLSDETWTERKIKGGQRQAEAQSSHWRWLATGRLDGVPGQVIWQIGHRRWGIENHAFNELTQAYDLEHCVRHESVAMEVWLLIRVLGFVLFELYARRHCQRVRQGAQTLRDLRDDLFLALGRWEELDPLWSG